MPESNRIHSLSESAPPQTRDLRIAGYRPLLPPAILMEELPLPPEGAVIVSRTRAEVVDILDERDDRLIVVVGPCSVHDTAAALEYARRVKALATAPDYEGLAMTRRYSKIMAQPLELADDQVVEIRARLMLEVAELMTLLQRDFLI